MVVRKEENVMIPCGIPYIFGTIGTSDKNILPDGGLVGLGVEIKVDEVTHIDAKTKVATTKSCEEIIYEKLVIGTGSNPLVPKWLTGTEKENVFTIPKDKVLSLLLDFTVIAATKPAALPPITNTSVCTILYLHKINVILKYCKNIFKLDYPICL